MELKQMNTTRVKPESIPEIISLMKLNGDAIVKKAIVAFQKGNIVIIHNKANSKIPVSLPFIIVAQNNNPVVYVFADRFMDNINSPREYINLMAVLEAAYLALALYKKPNAFIMNRALMLNLCNVYTRMVYTPLEQKLYMKGDNLIKAMLYIIAYFYKMIDGETMSVANMKPICKRLIQDKIDDGMLTQIVTEVKAMQNTSFMSLLELIKNINPVRYKDLSTMYLTYFTSSCGVSLIFALENLSYLFLLISSANYKTPVTAFGLNKSVGMTVKKSITLLSSMNLN